MKIKEYFTDSELACHCGCGKMPDEQSIELLYALRLYYGKPILVTSGARCETHNLRVGGSPMSTHLTGAFDIVVPAHDEWEIIRIAQFLGFTGIGISNNDFIHIDNKHQGPAIWTYNK